MFKKSQTNSWMQWPDETSRTWNLNNLIKRVTDKQSMKTGLKALPYTYAQYVLCEISGNFPCWFFVLTFGHYSLAWRSTTFSLELFSKFGNVCPQVWPKFGNCCPQVWAIIVPKVEDFLSPTFWILSLVLGFFLPPTSKEITQQHGRETC